MSCKSCSAPNPTTMCPSRMEDGRAFTNYYGRCFENSHLMSMVGTAPSSYESRMYLQRNAQQVMDMERARAVDTLIPCAPCRRPLTDDGTMAPSRYVVRCDAVSCTRTEVNPLGIGDARNYS